MNYCLLTNFGIKLSSSCMVLEGIILAYIRVIHTNKKEVMTLAYTSELYTEGNDVRLYIKVIY